jgi:ABC-2 type transport system permease protein
MRVALAFLRRDYLLAISYKLPFVLQLLTICCGVPVLFYISRVFSGAEIPALASYHGQYFPFLLLGVAFQDYVMLSQSTFNTSIREHQLMGTLEILMLSPTSVLWLLLCSALWGYLFTSVRFATFVLLGLAYGLDLSQANLLSFALVTVLAIASFASLGIVTASVTLLIKRGDVLNTILSSAAMILGGVAYPVHILPPLLQWAAWLLPFTHALSGMRKAMLLGVAPGGLLPEMAALAGFAIVLFPLGLWACTLAIQHAKSAGTLGQY